MMPANSLLLICRDASLIEQLRDEIGAEAGVHLDVIADFDQACDEIPEKTPGLIAIHLDEKTGAGHVSQLLWLSSQKARPVPVLTVCNAYEEREATDMLRMGVADYVSRADHLDKLGSVIVNLTQDTRGHVLSNDKVAARRGPKHRPAPSPVS